jgi:hypothetical protein
VLQRLHGLRMAMLPDEGIRQPDQDIAGRVVRILPTMSRPRRPEFVIQLEGRSVSGLGLREARSLEVIRAGRISLPICCLRARAPLGP